jgi:hypothetical protein
MRSGASMPGKYEKPSSSGPVLIAAFSIAAVIVGIILLFSGTSTPEGFSCGSVIHPMKRVDRDVGTSVFDTAGDGIENQQAIRPECASARQIRQTYGMDLVVGGLGLTMIMMCIGRLVRSS